MMVPRPKSFIFARFHTKSSKIHVFHRKNENPFIFPWQTRVDERERLVERNAKEAKKGMPRLVERNAKDFGMLEPPDGKFP